MEEWESEREGSGESEVAEPVAMSSNGLPIDTMIQRCAGIAHRLHQLGPLLTAPFSPTTMGELSQLSLFGEEARALAANLLLVADACSKRVAVAWDHPVKRDSSELSAENHPRPS